MHATRTATMTFKNLTGTHYEVGQALGQWTLSRPDLLQRVILPPNAYPADKLRAIEVLLDRHCAGVNEEIQGFADALKITPDQAMYYAASYVERGCSAMAALPSRTANGHALMARNYDFTDEIEELCFAYTDIDGAFRHVGSLLNLFGRCDGMNEHGLAVCITSNGIPVGNFEGGRKAGVTGFMFWAVVRSILEQCATVDEAVAWAMDAPIGFNINLMLADGEGRIGLLQCMDGHKGFRVLEENGSEGQTSQADHLAVTNHVVLDDVKPFETELLDNSVKRLAAIERLFDEHPTVAVDDLKTLLSTPYPDGLCCHYYPVFFGTLRSMVFDTTARSIEMTCGSPRANAWRRFAVEPLDEQDFSISLPCEDANEEFFHTR